MNFQPEASLQRQPLGIVVGGSVERGLQVRLDPTVPVETIKVGTFIVIQGAALTYFGVATNISLEAIDPHYRSTPPDVANPFIAQVVTGTGVYGALEVTPMLTLAVAGQGQPQPAKSIPAPFSRVSTASHRDVEMVFGKEDAQHFAIGTPLDMEATVSLDIGKLVERSTGIFGKSGTGKTFLTRLLLIGILQSGLATNLVFDMHSEYGWAGSKEDGTWVKGLKQLFPSQVAVFAVDEESSRRRGLTPDLLVRIGYDEIEPEDIKALQETLNLSDVAADAAYAVERRYGQKQWLSTFLALSGRESEGRNERTIDNFSTLASEINVHEGALSTLQRRLRRLERLDFVVPHPDTSGQRSAVHHILDYLERGYHVVLEFGRYGDDLTAYILLANLLTRRIHQRYRERKEAALGDRGQEPRPLVITIEEAHKFLNPQVGSQTIFGTIAREMRKYNVTLLVIDQRPGSIDTEVMSQVGTKITCLLDDERDIDAVLAGASGRRELRTVLAKLESQQQALILGHAVPLPVVVHTREYGSEDSYRLLGSLDPAEAKARRDRELEDLFGDPV